MHIILTVVTESLLSTSEAVILTCLLTLTFSLAIGLISGSLITYMMIKKTRRAPVLSQLPVNTSQAEAEYEDVDVSPSKSKASKQTFEMGNNVAYGSAI